MKFGLEIPQNLYKKRFTDEEIDKLLRIKWWNFNEEDVKKCLPLLRSNNINKLLDFMENQ